MSEEKHQLHAGDDVTMTTQPTPPPPACYTKYIGIFFCLLFTLAMAVTSTVVKLIHIPATELVFARCCIQFIMLLPGMSYAEVTGKFTCLGHTGRMYALLVYRGVSSSAASLLLYNALQRIPIGDATAISFCRLGRIFIFKN